MIKGFITGSFRPFHKGHEALISFAKSNCDELTILITTLSDEVIPYKYRLKWVLSTYLDDPQIQIVADVIQEPSLEGVDLSIWWGEYVKQKYGNFDRVFTSEDYGDVFAKSMGAVHFKFNQNRDIIPISATLIREKPLTNWNYLNNFAKDYFIKKIAIVGTESTGKTTLAKRLAEHYKTEWCPEVGRELIKNSNKFSINDLKIVGIEHAKNIIKYTRLANKVLFIDTELNITKSYAKFMFNKNISFDPWVEKANSIDLYLYLDKEAPYYDDGTRLSEKDRDILDESHINFFKDKKNVQYLPWLTQINGDTEKYEERFRYAIKIIDSFISKF